MTRILRTSLVGPAAARLAFMVAACASLALLTPTQASAHLDASTEPGIFACQASADPARDHEWRTDVDGNVSDSCDDDDDGDDESSNASGQLTSGREDLAPDFSYSAELIGVAEDRRGSRDRDAHLLRGPPARSKKSSDTFDDDTAGLHHSRSGRGVNGREPHLSFPGHPFRSAFARSHYGLRAPP